MKILLDSDNRAISAIFDICSDKLNIDIVKDKDLNSNNVDLIVKDCDANINIGGYNAEKTLFLIPKDFSSTSLIKYKIIKPFLPTELISILNSLEFLDPKSEFMNNNEVFSEPEYIDNNIDSTKDEISISVQNLINPNEVQKQTSELKDSNDFKEQEALLKDDESFKPIGLVDTDNFQEIIPVENNIFINDDIDENTGLISLANENDKENYSFLDSNYGNNETLTVPVKVETEKENLSEDFLSDDELLSLIDDKTNEGKTIEEIISELKNGNSKKNEEQKNQDRKENNLSNSDLIKLVQEDSSLLKQNDLPPTDNNAVESDSLSMVQEEKHITEIEKQNEVSPIVGYEEKNIKELDKDENRQTMEDEKIRQKEEIKKENIKLINEIIGFLDSNETTIKNNNIVDNEDIKLIEKEELKNLLKTELNNSIKSLFEKYDAKDILKDMHIKIDISFEDKN